MSDGQNKRDLTLSESFHRIKRTSLILSLLVIATFIPGIEQDARGGLVTGFSLKDVPLDFVRSLLWIAATYYGVGFLGEFIQEKLAQNRDLDSPGLRRLDEVTAETASHLVGLKETLQMMDKSLRAAIHQHGAESSEAKMLENLKARIAEWSNTRWDETRPPLQVRIDDVTSAAFRDYQAVHAARLTAVESGSYNLAQALKTFEGRLALVRKEIKGFRFSVLSSRGWYFFGWEAGGVAIPWALATYLVWTQVDGKAVWAIFREMLAPH